MLLLVSGATRTVRRFHGHKHLGSFMTPFTGNSVHSMKDMPFACDNGAFTGFNEKSFVKMLESVKNHKPLFVCCPDVVGDAQKTMNLFDKWQPVIANYNLPVALVIQDGQEKEDMNWKKISAIFIGGSTEYKLSDKVRWIVREAKFRGKWVHMGRVNSLRRIGYARDIGCDSVDGSGFSKFPDQKIPMALEFLENHQNVLCFDEHI